MIILRTLRNFPSLSAVVPCRPAHGATPRIIPAWSAAVIHSSGFQYWCRDFRYAIDLPVQTSYRHNNLVLTWLAAVVGVPPTGIIYSFIKNKQARGLYMWQILRSIRTLLLIDVTIKL